MNVRATTRENGGAGSLPMRIAKKDRQQEDVRRAQDVDGSGHLHIDNVFEEEFPQVCHRSLRRTEF